jgi:saccharopine dehydrogenase-like NADP-dependent oxidoreductase
LLLFKQTFLFSGRLANHLTIIVLKKILIFGAGRSSTALIEYLCKLSRKENWMVILADQSLSLANSRIIPETNIQTVECNLENNRLVESLVENTDVVISMMPPSLHLILAKACLKYLKHFLTASYVSDEIMNLNQEVTEKGLLFLMETGLDPGIDHMSAMREIQQLNQEGARLLEFKSYTGGLIAPESDNNPWHYKFTWNPRNVILAGQGTAKYLEDGKIKNIPYGKLFERTTKITIEGTDFEGYLNRNSLKYHSQYGLSNIQTFLRGTLRIPPFCSAWNCFVQLGMTSDEYQIQDSENLRWVDFLETFLPLSLNKSTRENLIEYLKLDINGPEITLLENSGVFSEAKTGIPLATPAQLLQSLFEKSWTTTPNDKDMIVMQHQFVSLKDEKKQNTYTSLIVKGDDQHSAMSKTVGFPLAIACKLLLQNKIDITGVQIPIQEQLYKPILSELEEYGIQFKTSNT